VTAYLRGRPLLAGVVLGVGACFKLVAPYALVVLAVLELLRSPWGSGELRRRLGRLLRCALVSAAVFLALLTVLDRIATPYDATAGRRIDGGPFAHLSHMLAYAASQSSPHGPTGIASYPWEWLGDYRPIVYLNVNPSQPAAGLTGVHPAAHFLGMISPPVLLVALIALALAVSRIVRPRRRGPPGERERLGVAWVIGTLVPFELLSLFWARTSYLYYMVIVMPGLYLLGGELVARVAAGRRRRLLIGWSLTALAAAVVMYPFTPLP
jgi:4-amino-4-deoxy-L-arabinose transferase-like glycosyltransferase